MNDYLSLDQQLCFAVYETSGEFNKLYTKALEPFNLTYPQYLVLLALWENDGPAQKELGEKVRLGTGTLNPMITRMAANGWVTKDRSSGDSRSVVISLTEQAKNTKHEIALAIKKAIERCGIHPEEYFELMKLLGSVRDKMKRSRIEQ
ncbi:MarR family winged helix-turn-helix transcriptional regulator [Jeotgalibacillus terrae]|uniref:HTH-type transcriptional regulator SarZ n=1 Tax=Jeotgalibacillus terrae TaxID=587735 RepID=A0ABW5ZIB1_9BACL|nr:MarR family transcriptional regulator [Jeotgalibacillus terrae]MBM7578680.1 DNA-binding MarR family transcriptional regulator [Jeotgalibacillus terrae]